MTPKPIPCPYHPGCDVGVLVPGKENPLWQVVADCGAAGPCQDSREKAVEIWNSRTAVPSVPTSELKTLISTMTQFFSTTPPKPGSFQAGVDSACWQFSRALQRLMDVRRKND